MVGLIRHIRKESHPSPRRFQECCQLTNDAIHEILVLGDLERQDLKKINAMYSFQGKVFNHTFLDSECQKQTLFSNDKVVRKIKFR